MTVVDAAREESLEPELSPQRVVPVPPPVLGVMWAMVERDLRIVRNELGVFVLRVISQPLLFIFVFTYVFPRVGQAVGGAAGSQAFATLIIPGTVAISAFTQAMGAVAVPLIVDLGYAREIEDRALAPLLWPLLAAQRVIVGTCEGIIAGFVVFPLAALIPSGSASLDIQWPLFILVASLAAMSGAALGLMLGTLFRPSTIPHMFSFLAVPVTFLGTSYFPWGSLDAIPVMKWLVLGNPLVYANEALRAATFGTYAAMPLGLALLGLAVSILVFYSIGTNRLAHRIRGD